MNQILINNDNNNDNIVFKKIFLFLVSCIGIFILLFIVLSYNIFATDNVDNTIDLDELFNEYNVVPPYLDMISAADITIFENIALHTAINSRIEESATNNDTTNVTSDNVQHTNNNNNNNNNNNSTNKSNVTKSYSTIATLNIPSLGINYPVLSETSAELLKISLNKYWGGDPNEVGNFCIVGHNYKNKTHFGKLSQISNGALVYLTDNSGRTLTYKVYDTYTIDPYDTKCTSQLTNGKKEVTLITCIEHGTKRFVVKARET